MESDKKMDDGNTPSLKAWFFQQVFRRFGIGGLIGLAFVSAPLLGWWQWDKVSKLPGIASLWERFARASVPHADSTRFSILVARLENDPDREQERLILQLMREFQGVEVLSLDRMISGAESEGREGSGHAAAREYLRKSKAALIIWGSVLHNDGKTRPQLYMTSAHQSPNRPRQYPIQIASADEFSLPPVFWSDVSKILQLLVNLRSGEFQAQAGRYIADKLPAFIAQLRQLLETSLDRPEWDSDARGRAQVILADALQDYGEQSGKNEPLTEAIAAYRSALTEYTRERAPLAWAMTQNNLGNALATLGERESGTEHLTEAIAAYRFALTEYTRERVPLKWATTQNNLGTALQTLGGRESGTEHLTEAIAAYRFALTERTRESVPLDWAATQNNLGTALATLGERKSGTEHLTEAIAAYRNAMQVYEKANHSPGMEVVDRNLKRTEALLHARRKPS